MFGLHLSVSFVLADSSVVPEIPGPDLVKNTAALKCRGVSRRSAPASLLSWPCTFVLFVPGVSVAAVNHSLDPSSRLGRLAPTSISRPVEAVISACCGRNSS